jgi:hypothetical protein
MSFTSNDFSEVKINHEFISLGQDCGRLLKMHPIASVPPEQKGAADKMFGREDVKRMPMSQQNGDLVLMRTGVRGDFIALQTEANELILTDSGKCKSGEWAPSAVVDLGLYLY